MPEEHESNSAKKRRIIHWNPDAGREQVSRRWTWKRIVGWSVGGVFALLLVAGVVIRVAKLVFGPDVFSSQVAAKASGPTVQDANSAFISQAKAEQAQELVTKQFAEIQKLPTEHPVQLQQMIMMETKLREGQTLARSHDFAQAFQVFDGLNRDIKAFSENVKIKGEAKQSYDKILLR